MNLLNKPFNPNDVGIENDNIFGFPYTLDDADIILLPVPWDVTTSYGGGASKGPEAILKASPQLDFADIEISNAWKIRTAMAPISPIISELSESLRPEAQKYIDFISKGGDISSNPELQESLKLINNGCDIMNAWVDSEADKYLKTNRLVGLIGGDHSTSYGFIKALARYYKNFGILHIDAHADLRNAYEGFTWSHASIMYNTLNNIPEVSHIAQVSIRDFCEDEKSLIINNKERITTFFNEDINYDLYEGCSWGMICDDIIASLPENVYISFDVDGLLPYYCPNTGTPVPGGLEFSQASYLIRRLSREGKKIIGFDLCEVCPGENDWDANVGARLAFMLSTQMALSHDL